MKYFFLVSSFKSLPFDLITEKCKKCLHAMNYDLYICPTRIYDFPPQLSQPSAGRGVKYIPEN